MLAQCVVSFRDSEAGVLREAGERFEVSPERLEQINATKYGTLAEEVSETAPEKPVRRARGRKPKQAG